jgi:hypothetical protein
MEYSGCFVELLSLFCLLARKYVHLIVRRRRRGGLILLEPLTKDAASISVRRMGSQRIEVRFQIHA